MNNSKVITGKQLKDMLLGAYHSFEKNFEAINDLNVFPVPDGDTGTNMMHTMASVAKAISAMSDEAEAVNHLLSTRGGARSETAACLRFFFVHGKTAAR